MVNPNELAPVLAEIIGQNDLGLTKYYEVVYFDKENDNEWKSYSGSNTFENGEKVLKWKYCSDLL